MFIEVDLLFDNKLAAALLLKYEITTHCLLYITYAPVYICTTTAHWHTMWTKLNLNIFLGIAKFNILYEPIIFQL